MPLNNFQLKYAVDLWIYVIFDFFCVWSGEVFSMEMTVKIWLWLFEHSVWVRNLCMHQLLFFRGCSNHIILHQVFYFTSLNCKVAGSFMKEWVIFEFLQIEFSIVGVALMMCECIRCEASFNPSSHDSHIELSTVLTIFSKWSVVF